MDTGDTAALPRPVARQAVAWWVALQADDVDARQRQAWQAWRSASPLHEQAWQRIEAIGGELGRLPAGLAQNTLATSRGPRRRDLLRGVVALVAVGGATWGLQRHGPTAADHRTGTAQRLPLVLADGSQITLDAASALDVDLGQNERRLRLRAGQILVQTAPDPRPFVVQTAAGTLRALGTRFVVQCHAEGTRVAVLAGAVRLEPASGASHHTVPTGAVGWLAPTRADALPGAADAADAWTRGMLVASGMPLGQFLAAVARYRPGRLTCDPTIATLRVSGTYPLGDTDAILAALPAALPVHVSRTTRYWVSVQPRRRKSLS